MAEVKTNFKIDKKNRVVVCIIETSAWDVFDKLDKYDLAYGFDVKPQDTKRFVGVAKCAPEDEWDESYGKKLAEYRASTKRKNYVNRCLMNHADKIVNNINHLINFGFLKDCRPPKI